MLGWMNMLADHRMECAIAGNDIMSLASAKRFDYLAKRLARWLANISFLI